MTRSKFSIFNKFIDHSPARRGFTLIELLVTVSIIGVLSTLVLANLNAGRERGRDVQRKSDLRQIQAGLRLWYNDQGVYPDTGASNKIKGCGTAGAETDCSWGQTWSLGSTTYMEPLPKDPVSSRNYIYARTSLDEYTLKACLENKSDDDCGATESWCTNGCVYTVRQ